MNSFQDYNFNSMKSDAEKKFLELLRKPIKNKEEIVKMNKFADLFEQELNQESKNLIGELKVLGLEATSIWDLVNMKAKYPNGVVDVLLKYLPENFHQRNKEGIVRSLITKQAQGKAAPALVEEYEKTPKENNDLRWVIGNAIATTMTLKEVEWIYATVLDKTNGTSRSSLVLGLGTVKTEKSENILISLLDDTDVAPQVLAALGKLKSKKAKDKILQIRECTTDSLIRLEATKALKKIG